MPPVNRDDEPIDIVARPVNPDGSLGEPETDPSPGPDFMHLAVPGSRGNDDSGSRREEVRYWRFEGAGDDRFGCGGCGCMTAIVLLLVLMLLRGCAGMILR